MNPKLSRRSTLTGMIAAPFTAAAFAAEPNSKGGENPGAPPITAITFSPDADHMITGSQAGLRVLDREEQTESSVPVAMDNVHCLQFSPDGKTLAVGGGDPAETGVIEWLKWPSKERLQRWTQHDDVIYQVSFSGDGAQFVAASGDEVCSVVARPSGQSVSRFTRHSKAVTSAVFLPDGQTVVSGSCDQTLRVWDSQTSTYIRTLHNHSRDVTCLAVNPSRVALPMVASASIDKTVRLWQPTIGRMVRFARLPSEPLCIAWCGDSQLIAGCRDGKARLINPNSVKVERTIDVSNGWLYCIAVNPIDDSEVVFGSDNGQVHRLNLS